MTDIKVRARYAPSPTGFFHIGGARTALFNYLFAKHYNGAFIVRIEDTDTSRNVQGGIESQLNNLKWMHIYPDESILNPKLEFGPYQQTAKLDRYRELANQLIKQNKAYYCFCSEVELQEQREMALKNHLTPKYNRNCLKLTPSEIQAKLAANVPHVIRLKMPDNINIEWDDLIRGHMSVPTSALTDPVILKSNNIPMYNFAVVIDDYDMKITHVLRGEEHISNTPYQIAIKQALGFDKQEIKYGHLSIITDETGKKLSKRNLTLKQFIEDYKEMGILPSAIDNFLALLGWSPKNHNEIYFDLDELIHDFDIDRVSKAPACFDFKKMLWINSQHIKNLTDTEYLKFIKPFINIDLNQITMSDKFDALLLSFKNQILYAKEINELISTNYLQTPYYELNHELTEFMNLESSKIIIKSLFEQLIIKNHDLSILEADQIINEIKKINPNIKGKNLFMPIRLIVTGKEHGPEMNKILYFIPINKILINIKSYLK